MNAIASRIARPTLDRPKGMPNAPYLEERTTLRVRFHEVDALHIVWHGHYVSYLEEGRRGFGRRYGVDYPVFLEHQVPVPVVQLELNYFAPARLADVLEVTTRLLKSETPKLVFEYDIRREGQEWLLASGRTVQVFATPAGELILAWPPFMRERLAAWEPLWKHPLPIPPSA